MPHSVYGWPIAGLWLGWLVYWIVAARDVKAARRQESLPARLAHHLPLLLGAILLGFGSLPLRWLDDRFLPRSWTAYWIGFLAVAAGLAFSVWARRHLGRNWSGSVTLKHNHELVRTGPYRYVRHPIYSGILLAILGTAIAIGEWRGLIAFVLLAVALVLKSRAEERFMEEAFRDGYARYRRDVPALIPRLGRGT
jgi:protein-S-isoprenylcysteine O-methyltransferase Ste14